MQELNYDQRLPIKINDVVIVYFTIIREIVN